MANHILDSLSFTNLTATTYEFLGGSASAYVRVQRFAPSVTTRGEDRPKMQMHGSHPRQVMWGSLTVAHEGLLVAPGHDTSAMMGERDTMMAAILGDLTAAPANTKVGTLTVKYESWGETASADVSLDGYDAELTVQPGVAIPYRFEWRLFTPYLIGNSTSAVFYL